MNKHAPEALKWIVNILKTNKFPFRISGGLAVKIYGSKRDLYDIDIDIPDKAIIKLLPLFEEFKYKGPKRYKDNEWDCYAISINYKGQDVDLIGSKSQRIFNKNTGKWENFKINLLNIKRKSIFGLTIPVIPKEELISYKSKIRRKIDLLDLDFLNKANHK